MHALEKLFFVVFLLNCKYHINEMGGFTMGANLKLVSWQKKKTRKQYNKLDQTESEKPKLHQRPETLFVASSSDRVLNFFVDFLEDD